MYLEEQQIFTSKIYITMTTTILLFDWSALTGIQQIFWGISIVFSVLFVIQFVLSIIGIDFDGDAEADFDGSGSVDGLDADFALLSVRSIIAFFTFFGWTGVVALSGGVGSMLAVLMASAAGFLAMLVVAYIFYLFMKLQSSGTLKLDNAIGGVGEVYLLIPDKQSGAGKVQMKVQGSLRELDAISTEGEIPTGAPVRVIDVLDNGMLLVEPVEATKYLE